MLVSPFRRGFLIYHDGKGEDIPVGAALTPRKNKVSMHTTQRASIRIVDDGSLDKVVVEFSCINLLEF